MTWLVAIRTFLGRIPSWAWVAVAAVAVVLFAYHKGASDKDDEWQARLEKAANQQAIKAAEARASADAEAAHRAEEHEAQQAELEGLIDEATRTDSNALDLLLDGLR